jgi:hypothetical protein
MGTVQRLKPREVEAAKAEPQPSAFAIPAVPYEPSDAERQSMKDWNRNYPPLPPMKVDQLGDTASIGPDHEDPGTGTALHMSAIAAGYADYYSGTLKAIGNIATTKRQVSAGKMDYLMAMVAGIKPRDQLESMLAVQMAAIHDATMEMAARMKRVDSIQQHDSADRSLNKLARTFAAQMEALKRYRSKGEQRVYVERVTVNKGGQAVVGVVERGRGGAKSDD